MYKKILLILGFVFISIGLVGCTKELTKTSENGYRYMIEVDGKHGYIDKKGKEIIKPQYDYAGEFSEGLAPVCNNIDKEENKKCGYIDINGKNVIPLKYEQANSFSNELGLVLSKGKYGFVNKTGTLVIKNIYTEAQSFSEGLATVKVNDKWGFIDKEGNIIIKPEFDVTGDFSNGLALAGNEKHYSEYSVATIAGYINKKGVFVIKPEPIGPYQYDFSDGVVAIQHNDVTPCEIKNTKGKTILNLEKLNYSNMSDGACYGTFSEGLMPVNVDYTANKWGYINKEGKLVFQVKLPYNLDNDPPEDFYYPLGPFSEGFATYYIGGKYGYIDKKWNIKIKPQFVEASNFKNELAYVKTKIKKGYINNEGSFVWWTKIKEE